MKTLAANVAGVQALKKKENPYLAHRTAPKAKTDTAAAVAGAPVVGSAPPEVPVDAVAVPAVSASAAPAVPIVDDRLKVRNRDGKAKRAFNFIEPGQLLTLTLVLFYVVKYLCSSRYLSEAGRPAAP